ncbi:hypothetical protein [Poriferisphaera sp. WC338]|uniref:hypothetical protein n=1 Tax=Poriferisphaera sp. WC338 TaxID=3425129 RepID=UPI003D816FA4
MGNIFISQVTDTEKVTGGWWRWPLVPVATIGGASVALLVLEVVVLYGCRWLGVVGETGFGYVHATTLMQYAFFGFCWAGIACLVAPKGKAIAGMVMTGVLGVLYLFAGFWVTIDPDVAVSLKLFFGLSVLVTLGAAMIAVNLKMFRKR